MKIIKLTLALALGSLVTACGAPDTASRNAGFTTETTQVRSFIAPTEALPSVKVEQINVVVPYSLKVSERNSYYPGGDIVWREDPIGDRHAQVKAIFETALAQGAAQVEGSVPVILDVQVERFHALTEKARYTTGGVHSITFKMRFRNPATGAVLGEPYQVVADLDGLGGRHALRAEARGQTQKVRITNHLAEVIRQELTTAQGYVNSNLGFMQALNRL